MIGLDCYHSIPGTPTQNRVSP